MSLIAIAVLALVLAATVVTIVVFHARARRAGRRFQILADIAGIADGDRTLEATLEAITEILVPELGDFCMIDLVEGEQVRRAAVRASGAQVEEEERGLAARPPIFQERMATDASATARQEPRLFERVTEDVLRDVAQDPEDLAFLISLGVRSYVAVELRARGRPTGILTLGVSHSGRRFHADDAEFVAVLAGRVALALDNAGLFSDLERSERERSEIAETLQRGLLPPPLPHIPGWSVAAMYRPAGVENEIGGDFYDAFRIAGGWMVVIGDVTGRGAQAASVTALARYTLRTAAALTGDPVVALETLNRALLGRAGASLCSVAALAIDEDPGQPVRLAIAGHPSPLLVDGESVTAVPLQAPVLGAFGDASWEVVEVEVRPGQHLVVVTDGVLEVSGQGERFGEERLRQTLVGASSPGLSTQRLEAALHGFTAGELDDDAAILAVGPTLSESEPVAVEDVELIERLYTAFEHRDPEELAAICDAAMEFFPVGTAEAIGRTAPYVGAAGLREYLNDADRAWEELRVTPMVVVRRGDSLLVRGRVYVRSRELGIRDMPIAWIWDVAEGLIVRGEVFNDPEMAELRFATAA
jgi:serine phosphatase RsbU (regulator of sigma subunit)/ketosteroid isomerase-like protein